MKTLKHLLSIIVVALPLSVEAKNNTPNYWKCNGRVGGSWTFGRAPNACNASDFGEDQYVFKNYDPVIFDDRSSSSSVERNEYMQSLYPFVRDVAQYYLKSRKPDVSNTELSYWTRAIFALAHQESYWSHYRYTTDGRLKMMRGDYGHGHGLTQVDDRWHFVAINQGKGWNLIENMMYSLDEYYAAWKRAPSQSCVASSNHYTSIARAAYSAYNGGPSRICRWTNPNDRWARNDKGYYDKYKQQSWLSYVADREAASFTDVACLAENGTHCEKKEGAGKLSQGDLIEDGKGGLCTFDANAKKFHCVSQDRDLACLDSINPANSDEVRMADARLLEDYQSQYYDRHQVCPLAQKSLYSVGSIIEVHKSINIRETPGGGKLGVILQGSLAQVLDFHLRDLDSHYTYYLVEYQGVRGYIYAGSVGSFEDWAGLSTKSLRQSSLVGSGLFGKVTAPYGINMRESAGGKLLTRVPKNARVYVDKIETESDENRIYYKVRYQGKAGYIYGGRIFPDFTVAEWLINE